METYKTDHKNDTCENALCDPADNNVSLADAQGMILNWVNFYDQYIAKHINSSDSGVFRGFYIPIVDLTNLLGIPYTENPYDYQGVRAYLAIENSQTEPPEQTIKLMLAPVTHDQSPLTPSMGRDKLCTGEQQNRSLIFDFTRPCPMQCDVSSPLFVQPNGSGYNHKRSK